MNCSVRRIEIENFDFDNVLRFQEACENGEFTDKELQELWRAFNEFDGDEDGLISLEDIEMVLKQRGVGQIDVHTLRQFATNLFKCWNPMGLNFIKFVLLMSAIQENDDCQEIFRFLDQKGEGQISVEELQEALNQYCEENLSVDEVRVMLEDAGLGAVDRIDYEDFQKIAEPESPSSDAGSEVLWFYNLGREDSSDSWDTTLFLKMKASPLSQSSEGASSILF